MNKKNLLSIILLLPAFFLFADEPEEEEKAWELSGFFQQNMNQVSFTNWAAGGENSFSSTSRARFNANYEQGYYAWENYVDLAYGIVKLEDNPTRKNTDNIDVFTKLGRKISEKFSYTALANFQSQFNKGYQYPNDSIVVSRFMAPAYLTVALGFDYKPWEFLSVFFSPATGKFTYVTNQDLADQGAYGVDPAEYDDLGNKVKDGRNINPEFGASVRIQFEKEVLPNVQINSRIVLFNNYTDEDVSNRKNTDVDWITNINMPINKFLTASVGFHLLYDHDILIPRYETQNGEQVQVGMRPTTQFKQQLGIGLVYNF